MQSFGSRRKLVIMLAALCAAVAVAPCARADLGSYTENISTVGQGLGAGCTPACPGPYAQMMVDLMDTTHAMVTITGLSNANYTYLIGDDQTALALWVNSTSFTASGFSVTQLPGFTAPTFSPSYPAQPAGGGFDSLGYFDFFLGETGVESFKTASESISFTLTDNSGSWGSVYSVLTDKGTFLYTHDVGVDVYACPAATCSANSANYVTGTAGAGDVAVPEPGSILLLGTLMILTGAIGRRRVRR